MVSNVFGEGLSSKKNMCTLVTAVGTLLQAFFFLFWADALLASRSQVASPAGLLTGRGTVASRVRA